MWRIVQKLIYISNVEISCLIFTVHYSSKSSKAGVLISFVFLMLNPTQSGNHFTVLRVMTVSGSQMSHRCDVIFWTFTVSMGAGIVQSVQSLAARWMTEESKLSPGILRIFSSPSLPDWGQPSLLSNEY